MTLPRRLLRDPRSAAGLLLVMLVVAGALVGPALSPYSAEGADFLATLAPPSAAHWLGTDDLGRDVLARVMNGGRVSLLVGVASVGAALAVGHADWAAGGLSRRGWVDAMC